jgi:hypothetical protein
LKKNGSAVLDYRGKIFKSGSDSTVAAVVDWRIEGRRLEQCMDILIRFYAEFLWEEGETADLQLPLPGGYWLNWNEWSDGFRPQFRGIKVSLLRNFRPDSSYNSFIAYLQTIFSESHTQQFYHAYKPVKKTDVQIGDFIVRKGTKGHAVMIVDLAKNKKGELIALIGNGDTPACQFFLLNFRLGNPWIPLESEEDMLDLPLRRKMSWDGLRRFNLPLDH